MDERQSSERVRLSVNLNKIALVRNARAGAEPDVDEFGAIALDAGAYGLTLHPRPDQRHATYEDVRSLSALCRARGAEINVEGNPSSAAWLEVVREVRPTQATLVPDPPEALTSEQGWALASDVAGLTNQATDRLKATVDDLKGRGIRVSLFIEPDAAEVEAAAAVGVDRVELRTQPYAEAFAAGNPDHLDETFALFWEAAEAAEACGLGLNAGHDLNLDNLPMVLGLPGLLEVSIGHALVVDALRMGFREAVERYVGVLEG